MTHRGPDDEGVYTRGSVGLGMRRLSIIDPATGHQPLSNEDGSVWIVFNGEIYNHAALRQKLERRGHGYRTQSDTESIIHLYEEYGQDCVRYLRGMFAFALWDERKKSLFLARDRFGIKPLYYRLAHNYFVFGSEIKVILAHPAVKPQFRIQALPEYLAFGYLSGEETFFKDIHKLPPGHTLDLKEGGELRVEPYWDLSLNPGGRKKTESHYRQTYRELLEEAVRSHLMSDVPVGVFLSGGVDSSAVAALMTQIRRSPIETFSVGYAEQGSSELPYARAVARHLHSIHHEVLLSREEFFRVLPKLIWHEDEPITWPSSVALYFVARLARERVKVVLTGEGSDETLAGYGRYAFTLRNLAFHRVYRDLVPGPVRHRVREYIKSAGMLGAPLRRRLEHTFLGRDGDSWSSFYFDNFFSAFSEDHQFSLLSEDLRRQLAPGATYQNVLNCWEKAPGDFLQRLLYTDIKSYLVELLMKQDNISMAASIESRVPFLDHALVEFAFNIPQEMQLNGLAGKQILKGAVADLLPHAILHRPKLGFPTPWRDWLAGPKLEHIRQLLLDEPSLDRGYFRRAALEQLFDEHRGGRCDHYDRIWRLLNLELWHRVCIDGATQPELDTSLLAAAS